MTVIGCVTAMFCFYVRVITHDFYVLFLYESYYS